LILNTSCHTTTPEPCISQRLQNLSQGSKTADEYTKEFYKYLTRVELAEMDNQLVSLYIGGLRQNIQNSLNLFDPINVFAAHQRALLLEKKGSQRIHRLLWAWHRGQHDSLQLAVHTSNTTQSSIPNMAPTTTGPPNRSATTNGPKCFKCGEPGHKILDCCKGDKYGKGPLIDSGNTFDEQGEEEE
jgi:hypothetical protein